MQHLTLPVQQKPCSGGQFRPISWCGYCPCDKILNSRNSALLKERRKASAKTLIVRKYDGSGLRCIMAAGNTSVAWGLKLE
jgi:hypothetical protein